MKTRESTLNNDNLIKIKNNVIDKTAALLPTVSVINARSLWPKLNTFADQFKETGTHLSMIIEIWGKGSKTAFFESQKIVANKGN